MTGYYDPTLYMGAGYVVTGSFYDPYQRLYYDHTYGNTYRERPGNPLVAIIIIVIVVAIICIIALSSKHSGEYEEVVIEEHHSDGYEGPA